MHEQSKKIVVGIDDSRGARHALRWALDQARVTGSNLVVIHAFTGSVAWIDVGSRDVEKIHAADQERALNDANRIVAEVADHGDDVTMTVLARIGEPTTTLINAADDADLVVVGARGRGGFAGALLGSVSQRLATHSPCPIVIVPDRQRTQS